MAIYVCRSSDGRLVSSCPSDDDPVASSDELAAQGLEAHIGLPELDDDHDWDASQKTVVTITEITASRWIPSYDFALAFTSDEYAGIKASADATVQHLMYALSLAQQVDLNAATIQQGLGYLTSAGLLAPGRAEAILQTGLS